jgi:hypothetical protein
MDERKVKTGLRVRTVNLGTTKGMLIADRHILARCNGITGTVLQYVPGHGGDMWFVEHDGTGEIGAYCFDELEAVE